MEFKEIEPEDLRVMRNLLEMAGIANLDWEHTKEFMLEMGYRIDMSPCEENTVLVTKIDTIDSMEVSIEVK